MSTAKERLRKLLEQRRATEPTAATGLVADPYQDEAVRLASEGLSFVLTGPAGSGKSTTLKRIIAALEQSPDLPILSRSLHKYLQDGAPGILITSFTNKAVENDKEILGKQYANSCLTIHKALEFEPVYLTNDQGKRVVVFEPKRTKHNPLPVSLAVVIMEEATLTNVPLWNQLWEALHPSTQVIFVGDIQQLPPVFGKPIFVHAMQRGLPVVELKNIYRQALESPILALAHRILSGKIIPAAELPEWSRYSEETGSRVQIRTWPKQIPELAALVVMQTWLPNQIQLGKYDPMEDIILTPFGKPGRFGAHELNNIVAGYLAKQANSEVWEIFTGISKKYFRIGDRVICDKQEGIIVNIRVNPSYYGQTPRAPSVNIDYSGVRTAADEVPEFEDEEDVLSTIDKMFEGLGSHVDDDSPTSRAASHLITVELWDGTQKHLSGAGEVFELVLGYAITVHKSQGSEFRRVLFLVHQSQSIAIFRELLYTAITRARTELVILCEPNTFVKGIVTQRLRGNTLEEKLREFDNYLEKQRKMGGGNESEIPNGLGTLLETNQVKEIV